MSIASWHEAAQVVVSYGGVDARIRDAWGATLLGVDPQTHAATLELWGVGIPSTAEGAPPSTAEGATSFSFEVDKERVYHIRPHITCIDWMPHPPPPQLPLSSPSPPHPPLPPAPPPPPHPPHPPACQRLDATDASFEECHDWCDPAFIGRDCAQCRCAACTFCPREMRRPVSADAADAADAAGTADAAEPPPAPANELPFETSCCMVSGRIQTLGDAEQLGAFVRPGSGRTRPPALHAAKKTAVGDIGGDARLVFTSKKSFSVDSLAPGTNYSLWLASQTRDGRWSRWSVPRSFATDKETTPPPVPQPPVPTVGVGCAELILRMPARRRSGCDADRKITLHMRLGTKTNGKTAWEVVDPLMTTIHGNTVRVRGLDAQALYEFRSVASNALGETPSESTGPLSLEIAPTGMLTPPTVAVTSTRSYRIDWSRLTTGCEHPCYLPPDPL